MAAEISQLAERREAMKKEKKHSEGVEEQAEALGPPQKEGVGAH